MQRKTRAPAEPDVLNSQGSEEIQAPRFSFRDFDIKLSRDTYEKEWVEAIGAPRVRSNPIALELPTGEEFTAALDRFRSGRANREDWQLLGRALFAALFPRKIEQLWDRDQRLLTEGTIVRLRLDVRDPELRMLPWELAFQGEGFPLALSPRHAITRYLYESRASATPPLDDVPRRVLVVAPSPAGALPVRIEEEVDAVRATLGSAQVDLLRPATLDGLRAALKRRYDVLHYVGHGAFTDDAGHLLLDKQAGHDGRLSGAVLGSMLQRSSVRLAVLNSCETAAQSRDPLLGVAQAVLAVGVPAAIAMQGVVSDHAGVIFARAIYEALGRQPLEICVTEARLLLFQERGEERADWGLPVLYTAASDAVPSSRPIRARSRARFTAESALGRSQKAPPRARLPDFDCLRFVGRDDDVAEVRRALARETGGSPVVVRGHPGAGSSTLARVVAGELLELSREDPYGQEAFDGIVWMSGGDVRINLLEPGEPEEMVPHGADEFYKAIAATLRSPALAQARPGERLTVLSEVLSENRCLLVVDNIDELRPRDRDRLLDLPGPTRVLATSHSSHVDVGTAINLGELDPSVALNLLQDEAGLECADERGRDALVAVAEASLGNPLVLHWAAGQLCASGADVGTVLAVLSDAGPDVLAERCLGHAVAGLAADELTVLGTLALFPGPPTRADVAVAAGLDEAAVERCLDSLAYDALVARGSKAGRPQLSPRARHHALTSLRARPEVVRTLTERAVEHVTSRLQTARSDQQLPDGDIENAMWAIQQAYEFGEWPRVLQLNQALNDALFERGRVNELLTAGALAWDAADRLGDRRKRAWAALYPLARVNFQQGNYDEAKRWCERARALFEQERFAIGRARAERYLGRVLQAKGQLDRAAEVFKSGLHRAQRLRPAQPQLHGDLLASLAGLAEQRGGDDQAQGDDETAHRAFGEAIRYYEKALALFEHIGHIRSITTMYASLGRVSLGAGRHAQAREYLEKSRGLLQSFEWPKRMGDVLFTLARLAEAETGDLREAEQLLRQSRDQYLEASAFADLARVEAAIARIKGLLTTDAARHAVASESIDDKHIAAWVAERPESDTRPLARGESYSMNLRVGAPVVGSLFDDRETVIPAGDVPEEGLQTAWTVRSEQVKLGAASAGVLVERREMVGKVLFRASFELKIPQVGDSAVVTLEVTPLHVPKSRIEITIEAHGEPYREFAVDLDVDDEVLEARGEPPVGIVDEDVITPAAHLGVRALHEWQTAPAQLAIRVGRDRVAGVKGEVRSDGAIQDYEDDVAWNVTVADVTGLIKNVRRSAERLRVKHDGYLNAIDPVDLVERLAGFVPAYDWAAAPCLADANHVGAWEAVAASQELRELAYDGHQLYQRVFPAGQPDQPLHGFVDAMLPGDRLDIGWTSTADGIVPDIPWGLMYIRDPTEPIDAMAFLGLRLRLGYRAYRTPTAVSRALGGADVAWRTHVLYWGGQANDATAAEAARQRALWTGGRDVCVPATAGAAARAAVLVALRRPQPSPMAVLHLFCRSEVGDGNDVTLQFGSTNAPEDVLRRFDLPSVALEDRPLVFANACGTSVSNPYYLNELERGFFDRGARAFLGTETRVPPVLAGRFAETFLHFFARKADPAPMAAGEAVAQARLFLWSNYRNIGGLLYAYINQFELYLANDDEIATMR